jgi:hypothetical protein
MSGSIGTSGAGAFWRALAHDQASITARTSGMIPEICDDEIVFSWISHIRTALPDVFSWVSSVVPSKWYNGLFDRLSDLAELVQRDAGTSRHSINGEDDTLRLSDSRIRKLGVPETWSHEFISTTHSL